MISYKDIKRAINEKLKANFDIEINSKDISEGFNRPSFFVDFENYSRTSLGDQIERSLTIRIYYFPSSTTRYSMEVIEVLGQLEDIFDSKLNVKDRYFNIQEVNGDVSDGVLQFDFEISFEDVRATDENEETTEMQVLKYENEV